MRTDAGPILALLATTALLLAPASGVAQPADAVTVAVRESPPFAMRSPDGEWVGVSVELWQEVADEADLAFTWREIPLEETLTALERGDVDVAIAALTVTAPRERRFDFAHPYISSGLALAVEAQEAGWLATLRAFFSVQFFTAVGALVVILAAAAFGVWIFERRANPEQFGGSLARGLGESFWWSAVTMTTVGYGDRSPVTRGGRVVALVWMFTSVIVIASFTASIAASLAVNRLEGSLAGEPITELRLGVLSHSRAEAYAHGQGLRSRAYASLDEAAEALGSDAVDALLHDAPILRHFARARFEDEIAVLPGIVVRDDYAFALPSGSSLRDRVNVALLRRLGDPSWANIRARHLGEGDDG